MTYSDTEPRGTLYYRLLSSSLSPKVSEPSSWGHEYIRHLAAELGEEYTMRAESLEPESAQPSANGDSSQPKAPKFAASNDELRELAMECAKFLLGHNAEADAVDLLEELEIVGRISELVDNNTFTRVCQYMVS